MRFIWWVSKSRERDFKNQKVNKKGILVFFLVEGERPVIKKRTRRMVYAIFFGTVTVCEKMTEQNDHL